MYREPVEVVFFKVRRFRLAIPGRQEVRTYTLWKKIGWAVLLPVWIIWALWLHVLEEFGYNKKPRDTKPETIVVAGSSDNRAAVHMVDSLRQSSRALCLVLSKSQLTFVEGRSPGQQPTPVWQSPPEAKVSFEKRLPNGLDLIWPDDTWAHFAFNSEQAAIARQYFQPGSYRA